jgi:hypothetical protein
MSEIDVSAEICSIVQIEVEESFIVLSSVEFKEQTCTRETITVVEHTNIFLCTNMYTDAQR